jgi:methyl-accepting chemotaxis protein
MGTGATAVNRVFPVARGRRPPRTATTKQMLTLVDLRGGAPSKVSPVQHPADHQGARDAAAVIDAVRDELDPEATASALRTWTDGLHTFAGNESALPDVKSMVKQYFDTVQQVLDSQRRLTEALFTVADTARTVSDQAIRATEHALNATQAATEGFASIAKGAGEQAGSVANATKSFA